jgi:N4-(beta-N-acetylglucosaminyl)-L-asparaginase
MTAPVSRRSFLAGSAALGAAGVLGLPAAPQPVAGSEAPAERGAPAHRRPLAIASANGLGAVEKAMELLRAGADTLEAAIAGVNLVEEDPEETSVGYGGLPNEDGVVELDSCVMHGPSWNAGAVAALQKIKTPSRVAQLVMTRTDHVLLVGKGALRFALAHGFKAEDLLTEKARRAWLAWKESLSEQDDWLTPEEGKRGLEARPSGTISCLALNEGGDLSGVTTTSGLAYKLPGRVGDSPIIGAGLYVDNDAGAAGATGRGEAVILAGGSRIVVENLRRGMSPAEAVLDVLGRIARQTVDPRLRDARGRPGFDVILYALRKDGAHAAASLRKGRKYAVNDGAASRLEDCLSFFED